MKERKRESEGPIPGSIGERIRGLRTDKGLSLETFGKIVGDNKNSVSLIELGKQDINVDKLQDYAKALDTTVYYLLTGTKDKNAFVAEDLGLSDDSIETLKKTKDWYRYKNVPEELLLQYKPKNTHPLHDIVDLLLKNEELTMLLWTYMFADLDNILVALPERYDLIYHDGSRFTNYEMIPVSSIQNFKEGNYSASSITDLEPITRLKIMDELKALRDSLKEERK